jgi:hypothetical protein
VVEHRVLRQMQEEHAVELAAGLSVRDSAESGLGASDPTSPDAVL